MKILVVLSRFPYPLTKGDKLRAFHQIKNLSKTNQIYLFCLSHEVVTQKEQEMLAPYCKEVCIVQLSKFTSILNIAKAFFSGKPFQVGYFFSKKAKQQYQNFQKKVCAEKIYCQFIRTIDYVKSSDLPIILDFQDALSKNMERRVQTSAFYLKPILKWETYQLKRYERNALELCNAATIISKADKDCICSEKQEMIQVVPNGVDLEYYQPSPLSTKEYDIVFAGNMSYAPNVNAVLFLIKEIMPKVWLRLPECKVLIAGATPAPSIAALAGEKVTVSGWVEDMRTCYASSRILVAPMQIGTGLQNKLLEAMAMQMPCITSPLANQALMAKSGEQILVAEKAEEYAESIIMLLENADFGRQIARAGRQYVVENFSWEKYTQDLEKIIEWA